MGLGFEAWLRPTSAAGPRRAQQAAGRRHRRKDAPAAAATQRRSPLRPLALLPPALRWQSLAAAALDAAAGSPHPAATRAASAPGAAPGCLPGCQPPAVRRTRAEGRSAADRHAQSGWATAADAVRNKGARSWVTAPLPAPAARTRSRVFSFVFRLTSSTHTRTQMCILMLEMFAKDSVNSGVAKAKTAVIV